MVEIWQVDINKSYWLDDDLNIWKTQEDFHEYHFEECHCPKDNYESWCQNLEEEHRLVEYDGSEIIKIIFDDMQETLDCYRNRKW